MGAVTAEDPEGSVTCRPPGDGGETTVPSWEWNGTIEGEAATLGFSSGSGDVPDMSVLRVGSKTWSHFPGQAGTVVTERVDRDGTLHVTATLSGTEDVEITAALRCPNWGYSTLTGAVVGHLDGTTSCEVLGDGYSYWEIRASGLAGQLQEGHLAFAGLNGPTVDAAQLFHGGVTWGAVNEAGQPPQIETTVYDVWGLTATATFRRLDGQPGTLEVDAAIACP